MVDPNYIDIEALSFTHNFNWETVINYIIDWNNGVEAHTCGGSTRNPDGSLRERLHQYPCEEKSPDPNGKRKHYRKTHRQEALDREHDFCESTQWQFHSTLAERRPCAHSPWDSCSGCPLSYLDPGPLGRSDVNNRIGVEPAHGGSHVSERGPGVSGGRDERENDQAQPIGLGKRHSAGRRHPGCRRKIRTVQDGKVVWVDPEETIIYTDKQMRDISRREVPIGLSIQEFGLNERGMLEYSGPDWNRTGCVGENEIEGN